MRGVNTAAGIVEYCRSKPMFREVNMQKYLSASTTRRSFYHVSADQVVSSVNSEVFMHRSVATLEGKKGM